MIAGRWWNAGGPVSTSRRGCAVAARAFKFIAAEMSRGDRLGHSWRDGRLLFPAA